MSDRETAYWCVNFDAGAGPMGGEERDVVLRYGLQRCLWAMQYQYRHDHHDYQENTPGGAITANWNAIGRIRPGDWCAAYLRPSTFYAVGEVITPRALARSGGQPVNRDTIGGSQKRRSHAYIDGIVEYTDAAGAFYEDFTDEWHLRNHNPDCAYCQAHPDDLEVWRYPQRIEVARWELVSARGVKVRGIVAAALSPHRRAAFRVSPEFFQRIRAALGAATEPTTT
jgi:hypothetical protein